MNSTEFEQKISEILDGQRVTAPDPSAYAAHYTRATTPNLLLQSATSNAMRQYDGDYMNDPEEGRYLVDVMIRAAQKSNHPCKGAFVERLAKLRSSRLLYSAYRKCTFLSCWTTTSIKPGQEEGSDSLNHWRFYGDNGAGACIAIPLTNLVTVFPDQLYRVNYGIDARGGGHAAADRPVRVLESAVKDRLDALRRSADLAMVDFEAVIRAVHPLLFVFKSDEYKAEQEVRSIIHKPNYATASGVQFDTRSPGPTRAFVTSNAGLICDGSIVYFGPKADPAYAIETMGTAANLGVDIQVFVSSMPYR